MKFCPICNNAYNITKNIPNKPEEDIGKNYAYLHCQNCNNFERMMNHTVVLVRSKQNQSASVSDDKLKKMIHDPTVPHTRNYVCPNDKCESHKNYELRDAIFFKPNKKSYVTLTICTVCQTGW